MALHNLSTIAVSPFAKPTFAPISPIHFQVETRQVDGSLISAFSIAHGMFCEG